MSTAQRSARLVLVTGSRFFEHRDVVWRAIESANPDVLVAGDCPTGADQFAREWVTAKNATPGLAVPVIYLRFAAEWDRLGRSAGPIRNQTMVDYLAVCDFADRVCLAFFTIGAPNRGTTHCSGAAAAAGIAVRKFYG